MTMAHANTASHDSTDYVRIFDTTLRDGEQSPGCTMNVEEKIALARQLERLNVDIIEAGFAVSSPGDFESITRVAQAVTEPVVLSLSRTGEKDVDSALQAVDKAAHPGIHIFIATSEIHLKYKLNMNREDVLDAATWAVTRAKKHLDYIEFSCEDASRSDWDYMVDVCSEVIRAGATVVNLPDTTGHAIPEEFGRMFAFMRESVPGADKVIWSAHCHNDLGLAVANSLAAIRNGARQVECTINGIGERAGNTSMEEVVMALKTRQDLMAVRTGIDTRQIYPASRLLSQIIGQPVPPNTPIVGQKAFAAFKELCDKKKIVYDDDILALANEESRRTADQFELVDLIVTSSTRSTPRAEVTMRVAGAERNADATGDGMVDACYKAIYKIAGITPTLERYSVKAITGGTDALGEVSCLVREDGMTVAGQGAHSDIVMASALALVNAMNRLKARAPLLEKDAAVG